MKRALTAAALTFAVMAACVPWDELVDECLESGRCVVQPDGAVVDVDGGDTDAGTDVDSGIEDAGTDAGVDAGQCPAPVDDAADAGGCRHGGVCAAVFVDGGPVRIFSVEKTNPCGSASMPTVSVVGMKGLFAWGDVDAGPATGAPSRVRWAEVALDNPVVNPANVTSSTFAQSYPAVAYRGDSGVVAWTMETVASRFNDAYVATLSSGALSAAIPAFERDEDQTELFLSASDAGYLLIFREEQHDAGTATQEGISGIRLGMNGQPVTAAPGSPLMMRTRLQTSPKAAFDGLDYRACWLDNVIAGGANDVFTAFVDTMTLAVGPNQGLGVSTDSGTAEAQPAIACANPNICAIAYSTAGGTVRVSIIVDGGVLGPPTRLSGGGVVANSDMGISYTGKDFLVVWAEDFGGTAGANIEYARVNLDGGVAKSETVILDVPGDQLRPAVSCSPQACAVVWEH